MMKKDNWLHLKKNMVQNLDQLRMFFFLFLIANSKTEKLNIQTLRFIQ